jgi:type II secretory pathway pseudopilin PulG
MIGVLAVIAILASLLIPKIYEAINNARVSNTVLSYNTVKTALADHYAKFGALLSSNGVTLPAPPGPGSTNFDAVLVAEGFLDKPFQVKMGDVGAHVEIAAGLAANIAPAAANTS